MKLPTYNKVSESEIVKLLLFSEVPSKTTREDEDLDIDEKPYTSPIAADDAKFFIHQKEY